MVRCTRSPRRLAAVAVVVAALFVPVEASAQQAPGGFVESANANNIRPRLVGSDVPELPAGRGPFTFPGPYSTRAARITTADDCEDSDCVYSVGYSYWRVTNFHENSNVILIVLSLRDHGGPTLFSYNKQTEEVLKLGPLQDPRWATATAENFYFSASQQNILYVSVDGTPALYRYDVETGGVSTVFDVSSHFGANSFKKQVHSSADDVVHSATLQDGSYQPLGCVVYFDNTGEYRLYARRSSNPTDYDECQVDKSGHWLVIKENFEPFGNDVHNRIINLDTGQETVLLDSAGAGGHSDLGWGWMVAKDDKYPDAANAVRVWTLGTDPPGPGTVVYHDAQWVQDNPETARHISVSHIRTPTGFEQQYACGSSANFPRQGGDPRLQAAARSDEIICFTLDGSNQTLVVAPVMTDMNASGGAWVSPGDPYGKWPKGNLDVTGNYFIWTTNMGGGRQDAFIVKVPKQLLTGGGGGDGGPGPDTLASGESLQPNQSRTSPDGSSTLIYQGDGNLVLYRSPAEPWSSNTQDTSPGFTAMQGDGNLVVYDSSGTPLCSSNTVGNNGAYLKVLNGGTIVIYSAGGTPLWTNGECYPVSR
jgi:hypothetical protein